MDGGDKILVAIGAGGAIGLGAFWWYYQDSPGNLLEQIINLATYVVARGQRLTRTIQNANGDIDDAPEYLATEASLIVGHPVSVDEYALARMLASEEPTSSEQTKIAISWVALNEARQRGVSVSALLLRDKGPGNGFFGEQRGRYASTRSDPYEGDLTIATDILAGRIPDTTNGAIHFYRPALQDKLYAKGKTSKSADQIAAEWGEGYTIDGVDSGIVFFG